MKGILPYLSFFLCLAFSLKAQETISTAPDASLVAFTYSVIDNSKVKIQWTTASETNNKEFYMFRSIDRQNWYVVGIIPARTHGGARQYEMVDFTASGGINYYKLQASDGSENRKDLGKLQVELEDLTKAVNIKPNRERGQIIVESAEQILTVELELSDFMKRVYPVSFVRDNSNQITIVIPGLEQGMYYLKCYLNGQRYVRRKAAFL